MAPDDADRDLGARALAAGELAVCVLAGGMATRMGGVVKALVEVEPGRTFLDLRLAERAHVAAEHGVAPPLWLMTSEPTEGPIAAALATHPQADDAVATFEQLVSLRLDPDGGLFLTDDQPSVYATGHGDLPDALQAAGLLDRFIAAGGRYVWICNLDNVGATVDPTILGGHIASGAELTVELVDKRGGDQGGGPVLHEGEPMICEHFRLPRDFAADSVTVFNTNTFIVNAEALRRVAGPDGMQWTFVEVHKDVGGRKAVQFERLLGEVTTALRPRLLRVSRDEPHSRVVPVKSNDDLPAARAALARMPWR